MNDFRASVRRFMDAEVLPYLDEWERAGELPRDLHDKAGKLGVLGVGFPEAVGGGGGSLLDAIAVVEEMHYAGGSGGLVASLGHRRALVHRRPRAGGQPGRHAGLRLRPARGGGTTEILTGLAAGRLGFST